MKRKLQFFAAFAAALALASCIYEPDDAIEYTTSDSTTSDDSSDATRVSLISSTSRATINDLGALQGSLEGFGVYAVSADTSNFFIEDGYIYSSNVWAWTSGGKYTWPTATTSYPVEFYAFYPLTDPAVDLAVVSADKSVEAEITIQKSDAQSDLLAAMTSLDMRPAGGAATISFNHILSQVNLSVSAGDNSTVRIQSVTFKGMERTNTFDYTTGAWDVLGADAADEESIFSYVAAHTPATVIDGDGGAITPNYGALMLLPQDLTHWDVTEDAALGARVVIVYRVTDGEDKNDLLGFTNASYTVNGGDPTTGELFIKVGFPVDGTWEMGKSYSYKVELGGLTSSGGYYISNKYFDASGNETELYIDEDIDVGDSVYDEEISLSVSVNDWTPVDGGLID